MNRYKDWLDQADIDINKAKLDIKHSYFNWACFTAQQAGEKGVKAACLKLGYDVWGHSITAILNKLKETINIPDEVLEAAQYLDAFYIPTRYPNGFSIGKPSDYYNKKIADEAINACEKILSFCKACCNG